MSRRKSGQFTDFANIRNNCDLTQSGQPQSGVRHVAGALMIGGGLIIEAAGSLVGAIGVSGAPGGELDDLCAAELPCLCEA